MIRHGSLFTGIGGFDLAAEWMGWENVFQVEWDKYCHKILAKNFPETLRFGDIMEFNRQLKDGKIITNANGGGYVHGKLKEQPTEGGVNALGQPDNGNSHGRVDIGHIDIISGGFPCQPFSHAGKRKGTDDSRYLWPAMLETIRILKPSFVVGENVAGLVSMENGKTLDRILSDLANEGYTTEQFIIPACGVGAWHRRDRIWIVAYKSGERLEGEFGKELQGGGDGFTDSYKNVSIHYSKNNSLTTNTQWTFPNSFSRGQSGQGQYEQPINTAEAKNRQAVKFESGSSSDQWGTEPSMGRVANGIPNRVDRLKGLGNAIVPQVAYQIFKAIEEYNFKYI
jgi:DNA (cytosine-5)-methyltransferase 1